MHARPLVLLALVTLASSACSAFDAFAPATPEHTESTAEFVDDGVRVTLTLAPTTLRAPGSVTATLRYENLRSEAVALTSSAGCLSFAAVYRGKTRVPFPATEYGCTAAVSVRQLKPGEPLAVEWRLGVGGPGGTSVPPGTYRFVALLNTHRANLERSFVVR